MKRQYIKNLPLAVIESECFLYIQRYVTYTCTNMCLFLQFFLFHSNIVITFVLFAPHNSRFQL